MDEPMRKSGQYPNVAIEAGSNPREVMEKYNEDTREQLEADIERYLSQAGCDEMVRGWLDRQAAITERELIESTRSDCDICGNDFRRQRDDIAYECFNYKLQCKQYEAKIAMLEAERDRLQKVVQIQADSFQKLERELKEALDGQAS